MTGVDRPLGGESPFVCGPRFAAGNIGGQFRKLVQKARRSKPEQHRHHHEVARAEVPIEPVGIAQPGRKLDQSIANAAFDQRQALFGPWLVTLREPGGHEFEDRRLHGVERGEHPGDCPRPRIGIVREQSRMVLGDVEDDRACLEQDKIAFLIGRNQAERMKAQMRGFLLRAEREEADLVGLAHLFKRPANARIARQALAAIGRPLKGGDDDGHRETPLRFASVASSPSATKSSGCSAAPARDRNGEPATLRIERSPRLAVRVIYTETRPTLGTHRWPPKSRYVLLTGAMPALAKHPRSPGADRAAHGRLPRPPGRRVGPAYLQNGADHGSLRPDLDVAGTANAVGQTASRATVLFPTTDYVRASSALAWLRDYGGRGSRTRFARKAGAARVASGTLRWTSSNRLGAHAPYARSSGGTGIFGRGQPLQQERAG